MMLGWILRREIARFFICCEFGFLEGCICDSRVI